MDLTAAATGARQSMDEQGLIDAGCTFVFDGASARLGLCDHNRKRISVSRLGATAADQDLFGQLILLEIAHALTPYDLFGRPAGHRVAWQRAARRIGHTLGTRIRWPELAADTRS